jgi:hypothetical protein
MPLARAHCHQLCATPAPLTYAARERGFRRLAAEEGEEERGKDRKGRKEEERKNERKGKGKKERKKRNELSAFRN